MFRRLLAVGLISLLAACGGRVVPPPTPAPRPPVQPPVVRPTPPPPMPEPFYAPTEATGAQVAIIGSDPVRPGPDIRQLRLPEVMAGRALAAFRASCGGLQRRTDRTGLTRGSDWAEACAAAAARQSDPASFFVRHFETAVVGDGTAFATGYYEPSIRGCRTRRPGCETPIYRLPANRTAFTRAQIEDGGLNGQGLELAYAVDPIELFFLEVQGSGRVQFEDGSVMHIGYAGQNGRAYTAIGRVLRDRGILQPGGINMQSITAWMRSSPDGGRALMRENQSYVFFRELDSRGPRGAMGIPVTPLGTVATDPSYVPLGAPIILATMSDPRANGLWVAQDTGGAIRGANRFDTFWGAGAEAALIAGNMQSRGRALILLPRGTLARLAAGRSAP